MADKIKIHSVSNANVYADGASWLGKAKEVQVPEVVYKMVDHEALGMVGSTEFFAGIDKMETTIQWNAFYADVLKKMGNPNQSVKLQIRANLRVETSTGLVDEQPVVIFLTTTAKNFPGSNFKQHENVEMETKLVTTYFRMEINNEVITEIDVLANIFKVGGIDILAKYRRNIGA